MKEAKKKYVWELEVPGETLYFHPVGRPQQEQMMVWSRRMWVQWRGREEGTVEVRRNEAQDWLRIHGHLEMPSREELDKKHEDELGRFEAVLELAAKRFKKGVITREDVITSLITEVEQ